MPELSFEITGVEAVARGLTPFINFQLRVTNSNETPPIQGLILSAQIQIQAPGRRYSPAEKEKLVELFGTPERWGQTLRNRLWAFAHTTIGPFDRTAETTLSVPCSFDLNLAATKYFYALEDGDVPLLFLFSGSVFYCSPEGKFQLERVSWNKECTYVIPVSRWKELMEQHYPNCAWLYLNRDVFDQLCEYRRKNGFATWEKTVETLLHQDELQPSSDPLEEVPA